MAEEITVNPLLSLIGTWEGDKGTDLAPKPDEDENNPYYETLKIEPVGADLDNAEEQELTAVMYHQVVREIANDKVSHNETGYWIWDAANKTVMCTLSIPRGLSLVAGGTVEPKGEGAFKFEVEAGMDNPDWGIVQSSFLKEKATTKTFARTVQVTGDTLIYSQEMGLEIYNKQFAHKDVNTLKRVG